MAAVLGKIIRAFALFLIFSAPAAAIVVIPKDVAIEGATIHLGDVIDVTEASASVVESLRRTVLGYAPPPGQQRVIPLETIRMRILQYGFSPNEIRFASTREPLVTRPGRRLNLEEAASAILEKLRSWANNEEIIFKIEKMPDERMIPLGDVVYDIELPSRLSQNFFVTVTAKVAQEEFKMYATVRAIRLTDVVVAAKRIERGDVIGLSDVVLEKKDAFSLAQGAIMDTGSIVGMVSRRSFMPGDILVSSGFEEQKLVSRGEKVRIVANLGGIRVTSFGTAYETGGKGDVIKVRNQDSRKIITGRVSGSGEVVVLDE